MSEIRIESIIGSDAARFIKKDPEKLPLVASLYAASLLGMKTGRLTRATYFLLRHIDDILDGEMDTSKVSEGIIADPVRYAEQLKHQIAQVETDTSTIATSLATYVVPKLVDVAKPTDNPQASLNSVIDMMIFDHLRRQRRQSHTENELHGYYQQMLDSSIDVILISLKSQTRSDIAPEFSTNQGRLYSVRDLKKDWELGIINIPIEVLEAASLDTDATYEEMMTSPVIGDYLKLELHDSQALMSESTDRISQLGDRRAKLLLKGLSKGALRVNGTKE